jgi:hypothetical protein
MNVNQLWARHIIENFGWTLECGDYHVVCECYGGMLRHWFTPDMRRDLPVELLMDATAEKNKWLSSDTATRDALAVDFDRQIASLQENDSDIDWSREGF